MQNDFWYDFRKGPREISRSAGKVFTVITCIIDFNTVITVLAKPHEDLSENRIEIRFAKPPYFVDLLVNVLRRAVFFLVKVAP